MKNYIVTLFVNTFIFCVLNNTNAQIINTIAGNGTDGFSGDGGPATDAQLNFPLGISVDANNNVYIADCFNNRIRKVDGSTGIISTFAGNGTANYSGENIIATSASLFNPTGVFVDANSNNLYIADADNNCIRKVNLSTNKITRVAGSTIKGFSGDGGSALNANLSYPHSLYVDEIGNIFIADAFNNRIRKVNASTGIITTIAGNGTQDYSGDGGAATNAGLYYPYAVWGDKDGNIFIAVRNNHVVRRVDAISGIITTVAGDGSLGRWGDGGLAVNASLGYIEGITMDADENIYIPDISYPSLRKVNKATGIITLIAGDYTNGFSGDGGAATSAQMWSAQSVAIDKSGNIYITDNGNRRIRKISSIETLQTPGIISGNTNVCVGSYNVYSIDTVADASDYTWTIPNSWIGTSITNSISVKASSTSGNISVTANNANGSSLPQILTVTTNALPAKPSITTAGDILTSSIIANSYQWYVGNKVIENATNRSHTAIKVGFYQVKITDENTCSENSDSLFIKPSDIFELMWNNKKLITMYPNPVKNELFIEAEMFKNTSAEISNIEGKIIQIVDFTSSKSIINTKNFASGIYFIKIKNDLGVGVRKFTKE